MKVSMDYHPYSPRVKSSIVCCYILHDFFLNYRLRYGSVSFLLVLYTFAVLNMHWCACASSPVTQNKARKC